jgi:zinc knuckle protein
MASEQPNFGAVGFNDGRLEQDETMGGPMAGAEQPAPGPSAPMAEATGPTGPPPLRIDTTYQFGAGGVPPWTGTGGGPWTGAPPAATPQKDYRKNHVAKPDPFKERREFDRFTRSAYLYTTANPGEFPDDKSKVLFYLSYMKEGLPGQFAENVVQQMMDYEARGLNVEMEFKDFMEGMTNTFGDVNKGATAQEQLSRSYQGKMSAEAFFQVFEQRVRAAKYAYGHDAYLIQVMKKALNTEVVDMVYAMQDLPRTWEEFRDAAIRFDKRLEERRRDKQGEWRNRQIHPPGNNKGFQEKPRKYEPMEVDNSEVKKRTCYRCGSEEHLIRNCPKPDTRGEKKNNIRSVKVEKDGYVADNENGWGNAEDFPPAQQ